MCFLWSLYEDGGNHWCVHRGIDTMFIFGTIFPDCTQHSVELYNWSVTLTITDAPHQVNNHLYCLIKANGGSRKSYIKNICGKTTWSRIDHNMHSRISLSLSPNFPIYTSHLWHILTLLLQAMILSPILSPYPTHTSSTVESIYSRDQGIAGNYKIPFLPSPLCLCLKRSVNAGTERR